MKEDKARQYNDPKEWLLVQYYQGNPKARRWESLLLSATSSILLERIITVSYFWVFHMYGYLEELEACHTLVWSPTACQSTKMPRLLCDFPYLSIHSKSHPQSLIQEIKNFRGNLSVIHPTHRVPGVFGLQVWSFARLFVPICLRGRCLFFFLLFLATISHVNSSPCSGGKAIRIFKYGCFASPANFGASD